MSVTTPKTEEYQKESNHSKSIVLPKHEPCQDSRRNHTRYKGITFPKDQLHRRSMGDDSDATAPEAITVGAPKRTET